MFSVSNMSAVWNYKGLSTKQFTHFSIYRLCLEATLPVN